MRICAQAASIAQGGALPKCDIVDTTFHASRAPGPCTATQSARPTLRGKSRKVTFKLNGEWNGASPVLHNN